MVDAVMSMSLDDIIRANEQARGGAERKFSSRKPARDGVPRNVRTATSGRVSRRANYTRGDVNSTWKHDLFSEFGDKKLQTFIPLNTGPAELVISNLDYGVSDSDMQELFSEIGILNSASVHYDKSGRSLGTASVVFERRCDALTAMEKYKGELLDGLAMDIQLATVEANTFVGQKTSKRDGRGIKHRNSNRGPMGTRRNQNSGRNTQHGAARVAGGRGVPRGGSRPVPTAEQLDRELDTYVKERLCVSE